MVFLLGGNDKLIFVKNTDKKYFVRFYENVILTKLLLVKSNLYV